MYVYVLEPPFSFFIDVALHSQLKFRQVVLCDHIAMFLLELVQEIPLFSLRYCCQQTILNSLASLSSR